MFRPLFSNSSSFINSMRVQLSTTTWRYSRFTVGCMVDMLEIPMEGLLTSRFQGRRLEKVIKSRRPGYFRDVDVDTILSEHGELLGMVDEEEFREPPGKHHIHIIVGMELRRSELPCVDGTNHAFVRCQCPRNYIVDRIPSQPAT